MPDFAADRRLIGNSFVLSWTIKNVVHGSAVPCVLEIARMLETRFRYTKEDSFRVFVYFLRVHCTGKEIEVAINRWNSY